MSPFNLAMESAHRTTREKMALVYRKQSLPYSIILFLLLLPQPSISCTSCYPERFILGGKPSNHRQYAQVIALSAYNGVRPHSNNRKMKSVAIATTGSQQIMNAISETCRFFQKYLHSIPKPAKLPILLTSLSITVLGVGVTAGYNHSSQVRRQQNQIWSNENFDDQDGGNGNDGEEPNPEVQKDESVMSSGMIATIGVYKNFISPLLPPACRFVPTCSQYGVQAIKEFGPAKGVILTSWRLLRCSPFGGKGYDPPKWPPVPYSYSSY